MESQWLSSTFSKRFAQKCDCLEHKVRFATLARSLARPTSKRNQPRYVSARGHPSYRPPPPTSITTACSIFYQANLWNPPSQPEPLYTTFKYLNYLKRRPAQNQHPLRPLSW
ncbi:hypothetical protein DM02DRAFT_150744 [Periconia macrospinosa]|uniref:Uncharacterized protein n=1 Tax=Periconia macrospinosa TaxID=97972 RepID=A0A2V1EEC1_9PLEO|nr:hypothetical protein DM02DRAFT_150744 [Periconia macrospinosa]